MGTPIIYFLVKTFDEKSYRDQFLDGLLYMNSLDYFVNLEKGDYTGRGDRHEGVEAWLQPSKIQIEINGIKICSEDLAGPVSIQPTRYLAKNVFCMNAGYIGGDLPSEFATTKAFEEVLKIHPQNISLGQHTVVITNVKEFLRRVKAAAEEQNVALRGGLVDYYNPISFHGQFAENDVPFKKQLRFAHQREYRFVIDRQPGKVEPYSLLIGDLRDIAHVISVEDLNNGIKISAINLTI